MPPLTDPERLNAYKDALSNWRYTGYIQFDLTEQSRRWIKRELGIELEDLSRLMHEYVGAGGDIDEVREIRPEWYGEHEYHYDLSLAAAVVPVYIETQLNLRPPFQPDQPWILVVNVHAP